jgi:hypothetical protein
MNETSGSLRTAIGFAGAGCLEEEPSPSLGLIHPGFEQTRTGHIVMFVAQPMCLAHMRRELFVVITQLRKHIERRNIVGVIVQNTLQTVDVAD